MGSQFGESSPGVIWYLSMSVCQSQCFEHRHLFPQTNVENGKFVCKILLVFFKKSVFLQKPE